MINFDKLRKEVFDHLDSMSDEELLQELKKCGLKIDKEPSHTRDFSRE